MKIVIWEKGQWGILKGICLFIVCVIVGILLKIAACSLPNHLVRDNIMKSYDGFVQRMNYGRIPVSERSQNKIDFATEAYYVNTMYYDTESPVKQAFENRVYQPGGGVKAEDNPETRLVAVLEGNIKDSYSRPVYWWGAVSVIRPLLLVLTYEETVELLQYLFWILIAVSAYFIFTRLGGIFGFAYLIGLFEINAFAVPMAYCTGLAYLVMLCILCAVFLCLKRKDSIIPIMIVSGASIAYFDWLSTPIVGFTTPMIFALILMFQSEKLKSWKEGIGFFLQGAVSWAGSYLMMLVAKWGISSVILKENVFADAFGRTVEDMSYIREEVGGGLKTIYLALKGNMLYLSSSRNLFSISKYLFIAVIALAAAIFISIFIKYRKDTKALALPALVFFTSLAPIGWYIVFSSHEMIHAAFAYRSLSGTVTGVILAFYLSIDKEKWKNRTHFIKRKYENTIKEAN